uniref:Endonuclease/exonuclease/phosphatase domain-containing protein n=1 Tax=Salix viminalis TaxID=40686 RepID=A0A6N2L0Y7_SALVM
MRKERRSRIGSYAISSSMSTRDHRQQPCITCTTFNILAPIYKRLNINNDQDQNSRESDYRAYWLVRNQRILDSLLRERSSIICLQEFWLGNEELVNMYEKRLGDAGYLNFKLARTNNRLLIAVRKDYFRVINHRELLFNDCGDRVAQLLHVELAAPCSPCRNNDTRQEILIVNTHLLFPHDSSLSLVRLNQVYKILQYVESYQKENKLSPTPIMLCGDWNGSKRGHVYKSLRSQGFVFLMILLISKLMRMLTRNHSRGEAGRIMEAGGRVKKCFVSSQAVMSMGMVQVMATGMQLLSKIILNDGKFRHQK